MDREYYSRGERKSVEVLDDVVAIKVAPDDRGLAPTQRASAPKPWLRMRAYHGRRWRHFRNANWLIVEPAADVSRSLDVGRARRVPRTSGWWSGATTALLESPRSG